MQIVQTDTLKCWRAREEEIKQNRVRMETNSTLTFVLSCRLGQEVLLQARTRGIYVFVNVPITNEKMLQKPWTKNVRKEGIEILRNNK